MSERVKVAVRLRPLIEEELICKDKTICVETIDPNKKLIIIKKDFEKRQFQFDSVFDPKATQSQVYNDIARGVVGSVIKGFNGTIFCYGQTGTGKTYTMMGKLDSDEKGITPRTFEQIFNEIQADTNNIYTVQLGYLQIYMEMLLDLIRPDNQDVKIRECPDNGVFVSGLEWMEVESPQECLSIMNFAEKNKVVAFTNLNAHSSRSHSMLVIKVDKRQSKQHSRSMTISKKPKTDESILQSGNCVGTLYLVDLAGSERIKKSRATGDRLSEARSINYSLTALGKCIHALTGPKSTFVPFRDSKLTRILQDALGGNCKTALIVNVGPAGRHVEETLSSLTFGMRAMKVTNTPQINQNVDYEQLSLQLKMEIEMKDEIIQKLESQQVKLLQQVRMESSNSNLSSSDHQYKVKLEKAEEEHKAFLEEIDNMMVEQEQENEELKKQLAHVMQELDESKNREQSLEQEIEEFRNVQQQLENELEDALTNKNEFADTINQLQQKLELKERENQELKQTTVLSTKNNDIIKISKEKQNQMWRSELQQITSQYANKLEEVKRLEFQQQEKENNNIVEYRQRNEELCLQIKQYKYELSQQKEQEQQLLQSNLQLDECLQQQKECFQIEQSKLLTQIKDLESVNCEITKRLEQYEIKLKKQKDQQQQNEFAYQQELDTKNEHLNKIQGEYFEIQKQIALIKEQYSTIQTINQQKVKQLTNDNQMLINKNADYQLQFQQLIEKNNELLLQIQQSKSSQYHNYNQGLNNSKVEYQTNQSYVNEQNFDIELKKSITVSGVNEGQIVFELQMRIQQMEDYIDQLQSQLKLKENITDELQLRCSQQQKEADQLKFQMESFSKRSQQSLQRMEETMCQEVVRSVLEKMIFQVELNSFESDDISSRAPDSDLKLQMKSFSKQENAQLVESLFINSRQSQHNAIVECDEEEDNSSEIDYQLPKFSQSGKKIQQQLRMSKSRQDSVFSFSEKQQKKDAVSLYDDLSEINQQFDAQSPRSQLDEIQFQIDFNDANAVDKFMSQIKQKQVSLIQNNDLSVGSIQQAHSPQYLDSLSEKKAKINSRIGNEELQEVIKVMAQMLVEKSKTEQTVTNNTLETLRASLLDFNNLCNTLTTYFL
ncbi:unnamed protein product (macronuclear) [Paramecium tetraurelia]|uniref:Kinesin motor domain-containing protein n=1 Tax=Paramecium tetraurelia TaxID=5888 RepID=A0E4F4_PARTE|nr:uncharacterized protein GSPATT00023345001 [Paramecium tetraurelia]CAK90171.1 unnamed protein product [Paramecium tetraurelia]|eukprot:XP_001457568.1 hypothetical protein (macronuclear) [Paramecium tetraurelia strain d4-2]